MSADLPRRPFTELTPPVGGFDAARRSGQRRRRAKAALTSTAGAGLLVVVLALVGSTASHGDDSLRVTDPGPGQSASAQPEPTASTRPEATPPAVSPGQLASPGVVASSPPAEAGGPPPTSAPGGSAQAYRTPDLDRAYVSRATPTSTTVCSGSENGTTDPTVHYTVNWCTNALIVATPAGHDLVAEVCRDSSADATLSFDSSREVELVVERAGKAVWRWSVDHPVTGSQHTLAVAREHCWTWTAHWTDVDQAGRPLPHGDYTLVTTSSAAELVSKPSEQASFTL